MKLENLIVLSKHMDHPGFTSRNMIIDHTSIIAMEVSVGSTKRDIWVELRLSSGQTLVVNETVPEILTKIVDSNTNALGLTSKNETEREIATIRDKLIPRYPSIASAIHSGSGTIREED